MPAFINDLVFDTGLQLLTSSGQRVFICSAQPFTYPEAGTYKLGDAPATVNAPSDGTTGRRVLVDAISNGSVTGAGTQTAEYFALVDDTNERLLTSQAISNPQSVSNGNTFSLTQWETRIPDPT